MNILLDRLPESVSLADEEHPINWDFRAMILCELALSDPDLEEMQKALTVLDIFYPEGVTRTQWLEASDAFTWFYACGKEQGKQQANEKEDLDETIPKKEPTIFSYEHDAEYIFAAFLDQYRINLNTDILHWWSFKALMAGLRDDHQFSKILGYRSIKIDDSMTAEQKKFYRQMKKRYSLPDNRTQEQKEADFVEDFASLF